MNVFVIAFAALLACACSAQPKSDARFVDGIVASAIEDLSQQLKDDGYDPYELTDGYYYRLPVTDLVVVSAHVENLVVVGLSDIVINSINYGIITSRLTFDISLPRVTATIDESIADVTTFGYKVDGDAKGSISIYNTRLTGLVRLNLGIISGVSVRDINLVFTYGTVESNLSVVIMNEDYSSTVNDLLAVTIPWILDNNSNDINRLLEHYLREAIEENL